MKRLSQSQLLTLIIGRLPFGTCTIGGSSSCRPAILDIPKIGKIRIYLWTATRDQSRNGARPNEVKIQLRLPGQTPRTRGRLDTTIFPTFLLGYSPQYDVFISWPPHNHLEFGNSANVQVDLAAVEAAREYGWATGGKKRRMRYGGNEEPIAFAASELFNFLKGETFKDSAGRDKLPRGIGAVTSKELVVSGSMSDTSFPAMGAQLAAFLTGGNEDLLLTRLRALATARGEVLSGTDVSSCLSELLGFEGAHDSSAGGALARSEALVELGAQLDNRVRIMSAIWERLGHNSAVTLSHVDVLRYVYEDRRFVARGVGEGADLNAIVLPIAQSCDPQLVADDLELFIEDSEPTALLYEAILSRLDELGTAAPNADMAEADDLSELDGEYDDDDDDLEASDPVRATVDKFSVKHFWDYVEADWLDLAPAWQRQDVWSISKKRELVRSLLLGIPLPSIILHKSADRISIIDGKQRLTAIIQFMRNEWKLPNFQVPTGHPLYDCRGSWYRKPGRRSLSDDVRRSFELRQIPVLLFEDVTERRLRQIFHLYNVSGTRLNAAEIRNAVYQRNEIHRVAYVLAGEARPMPDLGIGDYESQMQFTGKLHAVLPTDKRYAVVAFLCRYLGYSRAAAKPGAEFKPVSTSAAINRYFDYVSRQEDAVGVAKEIMSAFTAAERYFDIDDERLAFFMRNPKGNRKFNALVATANMIGGQYLHECVEANLISDVDARRIASEAKVHYPRNQQTRTIWDYQARLLLGLRVAVGGGVPQARSVHWTEFFKRMTYARMPDAEQQP
jgi:hypothetical protein